MIRNFLLRIDLFGMPVAMNFSGKEKAKTSFGGLCSVLFFGFVVWVAFLGCKDLFSMAKPHVISNDSYSENPKKLTLSKENFPLAFGVRAPTSQSYTLYKDESIYKIRIFLTSLERIKHENGKVEEKWTETTFNTEECTPDYFGELASSFSDLKLDAIHCIAKDDLDKLSIQGAFSSPKYQALYVTISECNNATSKVPCAPREVLDTYLGGGWFSALFTNMVVNPTNFTRPNTRYRDTYYTMFNPTNYKELEIDLGYVEVKTDLGWIIEDTKTENFIKVNKAAEFIQFKPDLDKVLLTCIFQVSKLETSYSRSYKKIQVVLAEIGGLANAVLVIFLLLSTPYIKFKLREAMMNELFDIKILSKKKQADNPEKFSQPKQKNHGAKHSIYRKNSNVGHNTASNQSRVKIDIQTVNDPEENPTKTINLMSTKDGSLVVKSEVENRENTTKKEALSVESQPFTILINSPNRSRDLSKQDEVQLQPGESSSVKIATRKRTNLMLSSLSSAKDFMTKEDRNLSQTNAFESPSKLKCLEGDLEYLDFSSDSMINNEFKEVLKKSTLKPDKIDIYNVKRVSTFQKERILNEEKSTKINLKIWEFISSFFFKLDSVKQKMDIVQEGIKSVEERLDVVNILKKLREVDKLKALLLDHEQLILFNNLPKPEIRTKGCSQGLGPTQYPHIVLKKIKFVDEQATNQQVLEVLEKLSSKERKTKIDQRLLEIFFDT